MTIQELIDTHQSTYEKDLIIARDLLSNLLRDYCRQEGLIEIYTPSIVNIATDPVRSKDNELFSLNWYGQRVHLAQSAQIYKQKAISYGLDKIYAIGPFWRKEMRDTPRHLSEAWSLDVELANINSHTDIMQFTENMLIETTAKYKKELVEKTNLEVQKIEGPIMRIKYDEAITMLNKEQITIARGEDIGPIREQVLANIIKKETGKNIFFIEEYPDTVKKFYVEHLEGDRTKSFDLIYEGWELISGAKRETNYQTIVHAMKKDHISIEPYHQYLHMFKEGMPPHGGFGMGIDRLLAKLLYMPDIRTTTLFPRTKDLIT